MTGDASDPFSASSQVGGARLERPSLSFGDTDQLVFDLFADEFFDIDPDDAMDGAPPVFEVSFRQADFPLDSLVKRMDEERIVVPRFQREYVWPREHAERFIESLLLGLPVPAIYLAREPDGGKLLVVDGHQRLATIRAFYQGYLDKVPFTLDSIESRFKGVAYATLSSHDRGRLDDATMTGNILKQEVPENDFSSVFFVFERLNSGSLPLTRHEIRRAVNQGSLSELVDEVADRDTWMRLIKSVRRPGGLSSLEHRSRSREMVLRWLAFLRAGDRYADMATIPLTAEARGKENHSVVLFLDRFMREYRDIDDSVKAEWRALVDSSLTDLQPLADSPWQHAEAPNRAMFESMLVAWAQLEQRDRQHLERFRELGRSESFRAICREYTSRADNVERRHLFAAAALRGEPVDDVLRAPGLHER